MMYAIKLFNLHPLIYCNFTIFADLTHFISPLPIRTTHLRNPSAQPVSCSVVCSSVHPPPGRLPCLYSDDMSWNTFPLVLTSPTDGDSDVDESQALWSRPSAQLPHVTAESSIPLVTSR